MYKYTYHYASSLYSDSEEVLRIDGIFRTNDKILMTDDYKRLKDSIHELNDTIFEISNIAVISLSLIDERR